MIIIIILRVLSGDPTGYGAATSRVTALEEENTTLRQNLATADTRISTLENQVSELVALVRQLTGSEH